MKITQTPQFQPITIVLETREEAEALKDAVISSNPVQLLADLVDALDSTYWSSWQPTNKFADQLDAARTYVEQQRQGKE